LRLTSYELRKNHIPFKVIPDSAAGVVIRDQKIDLVITGADRIASNGDSANKLGTFMLSVLCKEYGIPFYIAAPSSTIDTNAGGFADIPIEERSSFELIQYLDPTLNIKNIDSFNPSFDVTPAENISGIITERGFFTYPYKFD
jgi:methylthioribose-1-phosphate isomerase